MNRINKLISSRSYEVELVSHSKFSKHFHTLAIRIKHWFTSQLDEMTQEYKYQPKKKIILNFLYIILGATVAAFGDAFFVLPLSIVSGGVSSMAIIASNVIPINIDINIWVYIFTWLFFIIGFFTLGIDYSFRTLLYAIFYPIMISIFSKIIDVAQVDGIKFLDLSLYGGTLPGIDTMVKGGGVSGIVALKYFVSSVVGGLIIGTGIGLALSGGGSSGGTDIINLTMNKYFGVKVGVSSFIVDGILIVVGLFVNGYNFIGSLIGLITALLCSIMIDKVFLSGKQYYLAFIISNKIMEINDFINNELGRGSTFLSATGGYSKEEKMVLQICFDRKDYSIIKEAINHIDPSAFVTVVQTKEVLGYGFSSNKKDSSKAEINALQARKLIAKARAKKRSTFTD